MALVLGISASLRNARYGIGNEAMVRDIAAIADDTALKEYLRQQTQIRFQDFVDAGRGAKRPFDEIYSQLRRLRGQRGMSNSEAAVAAALWGAKREGAEIRHLSLAHHFPMSGKARNLDDIRESILAADAVIISGPVYFGDRGSLAQSLIEFIAADEVLRQSCVGKVYAGLAVGAKRNGGQETTLIYQLLDMVNLDFLVVGNSSETTSQYGGTAVAGDVGAMHSDCEGIETSIGTGQRAARVSEMLRQGRAADAVLKDPLKIQMWLLQDNRDGLGKAYFEAWARELTASVSDVEISILDVTKSEVVRCIACDVCPIDVGPKGEYRCIIKSPDDFFVQHHQTLTEADAVLLCAFSPQDRSDVVSLYQRFIERTRYLRRDNYVFSDLLMAPFVISELSARQNLHLRMLTSAVRHHTVLHHPLIGMVHEGMLLGEGAMLDLGRAFLARARELTIGRFLRDMPEDTLYHPKGYVISAQKALEDHETGRTLQSIKVNAKAHSTRAKQRLWAG